MRRCSAFTSRGQKRLLLRCWKGHFPSLLCSVVSRLFGHVHEESKSLTWLISFSWFASLLMRTIKGLFSKGPGKWRSNGLQTISVRQFVWIWQRQKVRGLDMLEFVWKSTSPALSLGSI
ncbi:hypothetical protein LINPERHAP1_LOCUS17936 [Linum perenne]